MRDACSLVVEVLPGTARARGSTSRRSRLDSRRWLALLSSTIAKTRTIMARSAMATIATSVIFGSSASAYHYSPPLVRPNGLQPTRWAHVANKYVRLVSA